MSDDEIAKRKHYLSQTSITFIDECHKQLSLQERGCLALLNNALKFKFSATPPKQNQALCEENEFQYLRPQAIEDGALAPLLVDKTLPTDLSHQDILNCLLYQAHPNGGVLSEHKVIIYIGKTKDHSAIEAAKALKSFLVDSACMAPSLIHVFHSGNKADPSPCVKMAQDLTTFKNQTQGVTIVIRMLAEGYSDHYLDYVIDTTSYTNTADAHQKNGLVLRLNTEAPNKVGFAILKERKENSAQEVSCYPTNKQTILTQHRAFVSTVGQTIQSKRSPVEMSSSLLANPASQNKLTTSKKRKQRSAEKTYQIHGSPCFFSAGKVSRSGRTICQPSHPEYIDNGALSDNEHAEQDALNRQKTTEIAGMVNERRKMRVIVDEEESIAPSPQTTTYLPSSEPKPSNQFFS